MSIKSPATIYKVLEDALRATDDPLTCVDLYDQPEVKKHAESANKVSDYLGHMWRRGLLQRYYAPEGSKAKARFAYTWLVKAVDMTPQKIEALAVYENRLEARPNVTITEEDGRVHLDFPQFSITIQSKKNT